MSSYQYGFNATNQAVKEPVNQLTELEEELLNIIHDTSLAPLVRTTNIFKITSKYKHVLKKAVCGSLRGLKRVGDDQSSTDESDEVNMQSSEDDRQSSEDGEIKSREDSSEDEYMSNVESRK